MNKSILLWLNSDIDEIINNKIYDNLNDYKLCENLKEIKKDISDLVYKYYIEKE